MQGGEVPFIRLPHRLVMPIMAWDALASVAGLRVGEQSETVVRIVYCTAGDDLRTKLVERAG